MPYPVIPEYITVHLGAPDAPAQNVTVPFTDYIKNVASSEIYPTWPESALRANILAQISFALNRIYTEYYPSRGYDFDITNSTAMDQSFVYGRDIFENISRIVDEIFNNYIRRGNNIEPLFAVYCNGTTVTCEGLSQWGSVELANLGYVPYDILRTYYGDDINIVYNAPVSEVEPSVPEILLRLGSVGNDVAFMQTRLNRISANYPSIPKIDPVDGIFGVETENAVREFQRVFDLDVDGIMGKATWYKIQFVYNAVKKLNELFSEGLTFDEAVQQFQGVMAEGDKGYEVSVVQYYLNTVAEFIAEVPSVSMNGVFDEQMKNSVIAFQTYAGLPATGVVDDATWNLLFDAYYGIIQSLSPEQSGAEVPPFPGTFLKLGSTGPEVEQLQSFINAAAGVYEEIPEIPLTGIYDENTRDAIYAVQAVFGYPINGIVGPLTWDTLANIYNDVETGSGRAEGQFSGNDLSIGDGEG